MERRLIVVLSSIACGLVLLTDALYIVIINAQGPTPQPYIARFVAGYLAVLAALLVVALIARPEIVPIRVALRAAASGGLFTVGFLASSPIAVPLVTAGFLAFFALRATARETRSRPARLSGLVAAAVAVALLLTGLEVTQRVIVCPEQGTSAGGGSGLVTGPYQYECNNGQLRYHSG